ncbi:hypothetical protein D3C72_1122190 [compost metagenome]
MIGVEQGLAVIDHGIGAQEVECELGECALGRARELGGDAANHAHVIVRDHLQRHVFGATALGHAIGGFFVRGAGQRQVIPALGHGRQIAITAPAGAVLHAEVVHWHYVDDLTPTVIVHGCAVFAQHAAGHGIAQHFTQRGRAQGFHHARLVAFAQTARDAAVARHLDIAFLEGLHAAVVLVGGIKERIQHFAHGEAAVAHLDGAFAKHRHTHGAGLGQARHILALGLDQLAYSGFGQSVGSR